MVSYNLIASRIYKTLEQGNKWNSHTQ
jgi:hypothetical protein